MPTWEIRWTAIGKSVVEAERLTAAIEDVETRLTEDVEDVQISDHELVSGTVKSVSADLRFLGQVFPIAYLGEDDDPEMPLFLPLGPEWWANGHLVLHLDADPPPELQRGRRFQNVHTLDEVMGLLGPAAEPGPHRIGKVYQRFAAALNVAGAVVVHHRPENLPYATSIEYRIDEYLVAVIMCERMEVEK
jgi:hypothetical protein